MTYNTDRRKPLRGAARAAFLAEHGGRCYYCGDPIVDDEWDDEHVIARELLPPGGDADALSNRRPIHRHPCHKIKSRQDRKLIAKSNRIRRANGPVEDRRQTRHPIRGRGFQQGYRPIPSRKFPKRLT